MPFQRITAAPRARGRTPGRDGRELAAIFAGGVGGAVLRIWLGLHLAGAAPGWPWSTFAVNVSGSFLLAYVAAHLPGPMAPSTYLRALLSIGFCGAYTTFSTMQLELLRMVEADRYGLAVSYALASVTAGYLAIWLATALGRRAAVA